MAFVHKPGDHQLRAIEHWLYRLCAQPYMQVESRQGRACRITDIHYRRNHVDLALSPSRQAIVGVGEINYAELISWLVGQAQARRILRLKGQEAGN